MLRHWREHDVRLERCPETSSVRIPSERRSTRQSLSFWQAIPVFQPWLSSKIPFHSDSWAERSEFSMVPANSGISPQTEQVRSKVLAFALRTNEGSFILDTNASIVVLSRMLNQKQKWAHPIYQGLQQWLSFEIACILSAPKVHVADW